MASVDFLAPIDKTRFLGEEHAKDIKSRDDVDRSALTSCLGDLSVAVVAHASSATRHEQNHMKTITAHSEISSYNLSVLLLVPLHYT